MNLSNITFIEENNCDFTVFNLISGIEDVRGFFKTYGKIEIDKIIDFQNSAYKIDDFRIEPAEEGFLNLDLYLSKV